MSTEKDDIFDDVNEKTENKKDNKTKLEFKQGCGLDVGTSNLCFVRQTEDGTFVNKFHRNMIFPLDVSDEADNLLEKSDYLYVKIGNKYYILGDDALSIAAATKGEVIRSMKDGLLNPQIKESSDLLFHIIGALVGKPIVKGENIRFTTPANSINQDNDNTFHKMILMNYLNSLGYNAKPVNEAMCVAYDCSPISKDGENIIPLSGVSISCGAGMTNLALLFKGMELASFSITKSGDYIDEQVSKVTGVAKSKIIKRKEKELDLEKVDHKDRVLSALSIYYTEYISRICHLIAQEFTKRESEIQGEIEIVIAGGTSLPNGFISKFEQTLKEQSLPFKILRIRKAQSQFFSVGQGACLRAQGDYQKSNKNAN